MTTEQKPKTTSTRTITVKGIAIAVMTLAMLIPSFMIQDLIMERKSTRNEAVRRIDAKWSYAQTISGPLLVVPYTQTFLDKDNKATITKGVFNITPENLDIRSTLFPEERYYGIYKTILYKSTTNMKGEFLPIDKQTLPTGDIHWDKAYLKFGVSDLRGISENILFDVNGKIIQAQVAGENDPMLNEVLRVNIDNMNPDINLNFNCDLSLKGSGSINFTPVGRTTDVTVSGAWAAPGFIGNYTPEYTLSNNEFEANWKILKFNRSIPDIWVDNRFISNNGISFGVNLVETVDIYQQNMRSAKYALMFIALTFVVFFFVEIINRKRIHPIQYVLVGVALILFYSLLLSISEPLGFGLAYLISSVATIGLITAYTSTIFKNRKQTAVLTVILSCLYLFLYVILQLEDMALLVGSVGLFVILGITMYFSRKINWYSEEA